MNREIYRQKLLDPRWQRKRLTILQRADFKCEDCGAADKTLHVHHCIYRFGCEPWEQPDNEFRCLCGDCHEERAPFEQTAVTMFKQAMAALTLTEIDRLCGILAPGEDVLRRVLTVERTTTELNDRSAE